MDIELIKSLGVESGVLLVFCLLFGRWLTAYFNKKGETFAQKEDFKQLLTQQKQTAEVVESIRVEVAENSWLRQRRWEIKRETYAKVLRVLWYQQAREGAQLALIQNMSLGAMPPYAEFFQNIDREQLQNLHEDQFILFSAWMTVSEEACYVVRDYLNDVREMLGKEPSPEELQGHIDEMQNIAVRAFTQVLDISRKEFQQEVSLAEKAD